jgi:hypothetical protein
MQVWNLRAVVQLPEQLQACIPALSTSCLSGQPGNLRYAAQSVVQSCTAAPGQQHRGPWVEVAIASSSGVWRGTKASKRVLDEGLSSKYGHGSNYWR